MKAQPPVSFVVFFSAFAVIGALTTLNLPCPLSNGTGIIKGAQGLNVDSVQRKLVSIEQTHKFSACGTPIQWPKYTYKVSMVLTNNSNELSQGSVSVTFTPRFSGGQHFVAGDGEGETAELVEGDAPPTILSTFVEIPANTTRTIERVFSFQDQPYEAPPAESDGLHAVTVESGGDMHDPTCNPSGKVSFVEWLQVKVLKLVIK